MASWSYHTSPENAHRWAWDEYWKFYCQHPPTFHIEVIYPKKGMVMKKKKDKKKMMFGGKKKKSGRQKMARGMSAMMAPSPMMGGGGPFGGRGMA